MVLFNHLWIHHSPGALRIWWLGVKRNYELTFSITDSRGLMPDAFQIQPDPAATLIGRMTSQEPKAGPRFSPAQLATFMEMAMPKLCTETPGFPEGMTCEMERDEDGNGWHFHVRRLPPNG